MRSFLVISLLFLMSCSSVTTPKEPTVFNRADGIGLTTDNIDTTTTRLMEAADVHGLALALIDQDGVQHLKAYGMASIDKNIPLQTDTIM